MDEAAFWEAPGDPQSLLSWEQARLTGKGFTLGDASLGPPCWDREFDLPAAGVLTIRELIVEVAGGGNGQTAIRLDADVAWQPSRPPGDVVPNVARVVTISELAGGNPQAKRPPAPVTVTDTAVVGRLAALVDSLPVSPLSNEAVSCPAASGGSLQLAFRARSLGLSVGSPPTPACRRSPRQPPAAGRGCAPARRPAAVPAGRLPRLTRARLGPAADRLCCTGSLPEVFSRERDERTGCGGCRARAPCEDDASFDGRMRDGDRDHIAGLLLP